MENLPSGPFDTEDQARTHPAVRAVYDAMRASTRRGEMGDSGEAMILAACDRAGVELGKYDARIVRWLAGFEPQACAVVAGLVARAAHAGTPGPHAVTFDLIDGSETYFVLSEALERFADEQRAKAQFEDASASHERWADRADAMRADVEGAMDGHAGGAR
ncbi:MAG: hypothetical protein ACRDOI_09945 [Trebonia sp.]